MNKVSKVVLLVGVVMLIMTGMAVASDISNTKHNLRSTGINSAGTVGSLDEVCIYCHTPHGGNQAIAPLWNRLPGTTTFQVYTSATMTQTAAVSGTSVACMSCHDGVTSVNNLINVQGVNYTTGNTYLTGIAALGTDLRNDHPIGVSVTTSGDPDIKAPTLTEVRVFSNLVECASCHNVHDNTNTPFLRGSNAGSRLCLDCHSK